MTEPNKWSRPSHGFLTVTKVLLASNILFSSFASKKDANVANRRTGILFTDGIMSDDLSASQHAAKNLGGSMSDSSLSAGELRRRHGVRDNPKDWGERAAPGVRGADGDSSGTVVALLGFLVLVVVVAYFLRG